MWRVEKVNIEWWLTESEVNCSNVCSRMAFIVYMIPCKSKAKNTHTLNMLLLQEFKMRWDINDGNNGRTAERLNKRTETRPNASHRNKKCRSRNAHAIIWTQRLLELNLSTESHANCAPEAHTPFLLNQFRSNNGTENYSLNMCNVFIFSHSLSSFRLVLNGFGWPFYNDC